MANNETQALFLATLSKGCNSVRKTLLISKPFNE